MCEGPSMISGPIPPDPTLFPEYYRRPASARGRLEGNREANAALLSGPLAPDPSLYPGFYSARAPPPPRIGQNATHILERGRKGMVGTLLALEGISLTPSPPRLKQQVRDHGKENVRRLREIQKRCREQEAERERNRPVPVKALWTSPKYQDVPSKLMSRLQETSPPNKLECQNFLKGHSRCGSTGLPRPRSSPSPNTSSSPNSEICVQGRAVDFVSYNARSAGKTTLRRSQSLQNLAPKQAPPTPSQKGRVPQYLEERKQQWRREAEERRKNTPDPSIPPGHTMMSEPERQETLQSLKDNQQSLVKELLSLPVRMDTLGVRSRRAELDRKLSEVEEAIKIFSRDKVYIKIDS
ncbi:hypothetical protein SKAU_G00011030 [Synaphobranchus kaupii]|uniref:Enkurin domain-containing protein n=1 Tax=Synaphobranchus kaupii TaxID=118154 RepID=A0A9Q1JCY5_SYNKA|nr:hypothetical protein SKAU_G00011030 [Synaphobranchus kaupii]